MGLGLSVALAVVAGLIAATGVVAALVAAIRQQRGQGTQWSAGLMGRAKLRSVSSMAALVLAVSTFTPWIFGSAIGVSLPSTLWGLPWARWIFGVPAVLAVVLVVALPWESMGWLRVVTCLVLGVCTGLGGLAMIGVAAASDASRTTFVADTLLRGLGHAHDLAPVARTGVGAPIYCFAAVTVWAVALNFRIGRRGVVALAADPVFDSSDTSVSQPTPDRFNPGDDWWQ